MRLHPTSTTNNDDVSEGARISTVYGLGVLEGPPRLDPVKNTAEAVRLAWDAMPDLRFVVAVGACAISGGLYASAPPLDRAFLEDVAPAAILDLRGIA
jgi:hypothetical protein